MLETGVWLLAAAGLFWSAYTLGHWHGWQKGYDTCFRAVNSEGHREAQADAIAAMLKKRGYEVEPVDAETGQPVRFERGEG